MAFFFGPEATKPFGKTVTYYVAFSWAVLGHADLLSARFGLVDTAFDFVLYGSALGFAVLLTYGAAEALRHRVRKMVERDTREELREMAKAETKRIQSKEWVNLETMSPSELSELYNKSKAVALHSISPIRGSVLYRMSPSELSELYKRNPEFYGILMSRAKHKSSEIGPDIMRLHSPKSYSLPHRALGPSSAPPSEAPDPGMYTEIMQVGDLEPRPGRAEHPVTASKPKTKDLAVGPIRAAILLGAAALAVARGVAPIWVYPLTLLAFAYLLAARFRK